MRSQSIFRVVFNGRAWRRAACDTYEGFVASVRLCVSMVGVATLTGAVALVSLPVARDVVARWIPEAGAHPMAGFDAAGAPNPAAVAEDGADASAADDADDEIDLDARWSRVATYLSRRYHVADGPVREIVVAAQKAGTENHVDPLLVLAVVAVESGMNPVAQSPVGAQGLMQVMTSVHSELFEPHGGDQAALEPVANIKVGTAILGDLIRRGGSVEKGLELYVGAGLTGGGSWYAVRVQAELGRLRLAAAGRLAEAFAGARADLPGNVPANLDASTNRAPAARGGQLPS